MQAEHKRQLPQEGTGAAGESLPVARPSNNEGRTAGCPPYSGEGNEPLRASHTRQPPATQMTPTEKPTHDPQPTTLPSVSTPLAVATPESPLIQSAWTRVEQKQRRKKPKKKKKNTNGRTDAPTGESRGQPTQEPGRSANRNTRTLAEGSYGQSGGQRPAAETVVSGQCKGVMDANQPSTSRGPSADTRDKHTRKGNTPAPRQPHPAAHRSTYWKERGSSKASATQHQPNSAAHRLTYWKERGSSETGAELGDPGPSTSQPRQKRDRLDDTTSPRGEHKKRKTDRQTASYARASQPHLNVAVALTPRRNMTNQEADNIQGQIEKEIFDTCLKPKTQGTIAYAPAFDGRAYLSDGVLKLWCLNEKSLSWLQNITPKLKSPREGTGLTLIRQSEITARVRSALFVPNYEGDIGKLELVLSLQNPWYEVATWTLFTYKRIQGRTPGLFLVLGIPKEQIPNLLARGRKVAYSTGSIYIRFFTKEGVSDVPPQEPPKPEESTSVPKATAPSQITDAQTDKNPDNSPSSSVSTVLEDIETMLTEEPPVAPSPPPSSSRWEETTVTGESDTTALTIQELLDTWAPKATD